MIAPWESLRVHVARGILATDNGLGGAGGPEIDLYDVSTDCTRPQLLASVRRYGNGRRRRPIGQSTGPRRGILAGRFYLLHRGKFSFSVGSKPYPIEVDEGGSGGFQDPAATNAQAACNAGMTPFPLVHIYAMSTEASPRLVSELRLETHRIRRTCAGAVHDDDASRPT